MGGKSSVNLWVSMTSCSKGQNMRVVRMVDESLSQFSVARCYYLQLYSREFRGLADCYLFSIFPYLAMGQ
jgi:hypothetical protein